MKRFKIILFLCSKEYADSLQDSGVHGAVLVLDLTFGADELAQALGIHPSKNIIRRHLTSELLSVLVPARYSKLVTTCGGGGGVEQTAEQALLFMHFLVEKRA